MGNKQDIMHIMDHDRRTRKRRRRRRRRWWWWRNGLTPTSCVSPVLFWSPAMQNGVGSKECVGHVTEPKKKQNKKNVKYLRFSSRGKEGGGIT